MGRYLAKTHVSARSLLQVVTGSFRHADTTDVVFGKHDALQLLEEAPDGELTLVCEQFVFGSIKDLKCYPATVRAPPHAARQPASGAHGRGWLP